MAADINFYIYKLVWLLITYLAGKNYQKMLTWFTLETFRHTRSNVDGISKSQMEFRAFFVRVDCFGGTVIIYALMNRSSPQKIAQRFIKVERGKRG